MRSLAGTFAVATIGGVGLALSTMCPPTPGPTPSPSPTVMVSPTPTPACPSPQPQATGRLACKLHGWITGEGGALRRVVDCTPLVKDAAYCWEVMGEARGECPVRPEGHPERGACEALLGAVVLYGRDCVPVGGNPLQYSIGAGECQLCMGDVCGEVFAR